MSELVLARIQFASTTLFHFLFVPLSIGLVFMVALMETLYVVKNKRPISKWLNFGASLLINFAVGVVTGILQEFQFGLNWSDYSRFVGDVFGAPLAVEALLAFLWSLFLSDYGFSAGTVYLKSAFALHLACVLRNDYVIFLDFDGELIHAGAGRLCD